MDACPVISTEIGCNHNGNLQNAFDMIEQVAKINQNLTNKCTIKIVKFQKKDIKTFLSKDEYNSPHPSPQNSFGKTYGEHREFLEFNMEAHKMLKRCCEKNHLTYSVSVFDIVSAKEMVNLKPDIIKISSANNLDFEVLEYIRDNFEGEIHISLGMTTETEEESITTVLKHRLKDTVLYACTSAYPAQMSDLCLLEIKRLKEKYHNRIKAVGFSAHHLGTTADIAAMVLGAKYIERHFTMDKSAKGSDHKISLEPDELKKLCEDLYDISLALNYKPAHILDSEKEIRKRLKRNVNV